MSCPKTVPAMSVASLNYSDRLETNLVTLEIDSMDKVHAVNNHITPYNLLNTLSFIKDFWRKNC